MFRVALQSPVMITGPFLSPLPHSKASFLFFIYYSCLLSTSLSLKHHFFLPTAVFSSHLVRFPLLPDLSFIRKGFCDLNRSLPLAFVLTITCRLPQRMVSLFTSCNFSGLGFFFWVYFERGHTMSQLSMSTWVPEIKLRSSDLIISTHICWAISAPHSYTFILICVILVSLMSTLSLPLAKLLSGEAISLSFFCPKRLAQHMLGQNMNEWNPLHFS